MIIRRVAAGYAMYDLGAIFRRRVTAQYLRLPLSWHGQHPTGQLLSNANADVEATWQVFAPLPMAIGVVVMLVVAAVAMLLVDPVLALIGFCVFPLVFAVNVVFQRWMSPRVTRAQQLRAEVSDVAHESFDGALVVKAMGREAGRDRAVRRGVRGGCATPTSSVGRTRGVFDPIIEAIPNLGTLAVLAVGTAQVASGATTAADGRPGGVPVHAARLPGPGARLGARRAAAQRRRLGPRAVACWTPSGGLTYGDRRLPERGAGPAASCTGSTRALGRGGRARCPVLHDVTCRAEPGRTVGAGRGHRRRASPR